MSTFGGPSVSGCGATGEAGGEEGGFGAGFPNVLIPNSEGGSNVPSSILARAARNGKPMAPWRIVPQRAIRNRMNTAYPLVKNPG